MQLDAPFFFFLFSQAYVTFCIELKTSPDLFPFLITACPTVDLFSPHALQQAVLAHCPGAALAPKCWLLPDNKPIQPCLPDLAMVASSP